MLTRGRDCAIVYVPSMTELDQTAAWLQECGVRVLGL
jgi:superfamily II DNA helicase RecQ